MSKINRSPLVKTAQKAYDTDDLYAALDQIGIQSGDNLCIHSSIQALGFPALSDPSTWKGPDFLGKFIEVIQDVIGSSGTLLMPSFTYSFCKNEIFDVQQTPSKVGTLNEFFRQMKQTQRTKDPIFSFAIAGSKKQHYLNISNSCFGANSVFDKIYKNDAKLIFLGTDARAMTFVHYIEQKAGVPYRYQKTFQGIIKDNDILEQASFLYYVRHLDQKSIFDSQIVKNFALQTHNLKSAAFGASHIICIDAKKICDDLASQLQADPLFLLGNQ